jgi:hypothetical protein
MIRTTVEESPFSIQLINGWCVILDDFALHAALMEIASRPPIDPCDYCGGSCNVGNHEH